MIHDFLEFLALGFKHVIPFGFDHILFILSIFFLTSDIKAVIIQCSIFTFAHSLTLALTVFGLIMPNSSVVEPLIAISILVTTIENIVSQKINPFRLMIIFGFGLIHGMGFANVLLASGIPHDSFFCSLLAFNLGVELGQIAIILLAYILVSKWFAHKLWYRERIVYPLSIMIGCVALYWTFERLLIL